MRHVVIWVGILLGARCTLPAQTATANEKRDREANVTARSTGPEFIPMTQVERLRYFLKSTGSPQALAMSAVGAGITQWEDSPTEWGQGALGYGRRFGNTFAQHIMRSTMIYGASSVLHEDNRYLSSGETGFGPRLKYALESTILARRDDGTRRISFSRLGGTAGTAFVSRLWQPPSTNTRGDALTSFGISMGVQAGVNVGREFLPSVFNRGGRR